MNRFKRWVNSPLVTGWLLVGIAIFCFGGSLLTHQDAIALRDHGVTTSAEVVEVHGGRNSYVVLTFATESGDHVRADVGNYYWDPAPHVGDRPTILYDPSDPAGNVADVRMGPDFFASWAFLIGGIVAAALTWPTFTGRITWKR